MDLARFRLAEVTALASVDLALAALPVRSAQLELLQLAGRGAGQFVAELDRRRALVASEALLTPRPQVRLGHFRTRREDHQRLDRLTPLVVRYPDDAHLGD